MLGATADLKPSQTRHPTPRGKGFHHFIKNYQLSGEAHWLFLGKAPAGRVQKIGCFLENRRNETSYSKKFLFPVVWDTKVGKHLTPALPTSAPITPRSWSPRADICLGSFGSQLYPAAQPLITSPWPRAEKQLTK